MQYMLRDSGGAREQNVRVRPGQQLNRNPLELFFKTRSLAEKYVAENITNAETIDQAREAIIHASETLTVLGTMRYISSMDERDSLVTISIQQYVEGRVQTAFQEFMEGLNTLKLAEAIQAHPAQFKELFLENTQQLNAADLINLFQPVLSTVGSSRRREESRVLCYWRDWLIDIEGGECAELHLEDILVFASGLSRIPPLGFPVQPTLEVPTYSKQHNKASSRGKYVQCSHSTTTAQIFRGI
ncbi:G2 M phase-specific E3 ubiquitin- ligase-like protein [Labeo rohita]|uniref:G2 M phase-specific E3 ubiquitin-ligase-like protein n=1 Tax=Labeo rohita TaxID=84645 RepID=A0A498P2J1_LABRO|nr:G2 M phase-specific E3 ubiquitin- ligase-like protein [Labeo rohita]RXN37764.1 G2 M phase-specific E3 ubiquitin- ligase-like protein [Labeo rohita]